MFAPKKENKIKGELIQHLLSNYYFFLDLYLLRSHPKVLWE